MYKRQLIQRIEVVVIKNQAHRQALDNKGWQLSAGAAPLLAGVAPVSYTHLPVPFLCL